MLSELVAGRFLPKLLGQVPQRATGLGSTAVALVEAPNMELTRAGRRFFLGVSAAPTGIAPVQAIPTTAAQWAIYNADAGKTYWFEELGLVLASGTPGLGASLWACVFQTPAQTGANATGMTAQNALASSGLTSKSIVKSGVTITTPAAPAWYQLGQSNDAIAAAAFSTGYANGVVRSDLAGAIGVPPGYALGLAMIGPAGTTPLYVPVARWLELESDNE
jgi:hypothetical protein